MESHVLTAILLCEIVVTGTLFAIYPSIARRGLLFGSYVGPDAVGKDDALALVRGWQLAIAASTVLAMAATVAAIMLFPSRPFAAVLPAIALPVAGFFFYLRAHRAARALASRLPPPPEAPPQGPGPSRPLARALPWATIAVCTLLGLHAVIFCASHYGELPDRIPTHFGLSGTPDGWSARSPASVLLLPLMALFLGSSLGGMTWLVAHAKKTVRHLDKGQSLAAQEQFRSAMTVYMAGIALLTTLLMSGLAIDAVEVGLGIRSKLGPMGNVGLVAILLWSIGGALVLALKVGQGGSRLEGAAAAAALTDGLADNRSWKIGLFYVNRDDPSWFVEHRFGLGYTINFGNPKAVAALVLWFLAMMAFLVWALTGMRPA